MPSFDPTQVLALLRPDGSSDLRAPSHQPTRIDGHTIGVACMSASAPHGGELHPDGDELLYLISGRVAVVEDDGDESDVGNEHREELTAGEAYLVPRGVWHRVEVLEPCELLHITPGPGGGHRPPRD